MSTWFASNENRWATTIGDPDFLPRWYVISANGIVLEADDGEVRWFDSDDEAQVAANTLNAGGDP